MTSPAEPGIDLDPATRDFYRGVLRLAREAGHHCLVGGAYAFTYYTGIERHTKDFDLFVLRADVPRLLDTFARAGYRAELTVPHWLAKVYQGDEFVDLIFRSANGLNEVDENWFEHAVEVTIFDEAVRLIAPEEMFCSKAFVMERERFDGADVAHLLRAQGARLDWSRLVARFGEHWPVLLAHLLLFRFSYPGEREAIPQDLLAGLLARAASHQDPAAAARLCRGTLLSREQYLPDVERWGYADARVRPWGTLTPEEVRRWTATIGEE